MTKLRANDRVRVLSTQFTRDGRRICSADTGGEVRKVYWKGFGDFDQVTQVAEVFLDSCYVVKVNVNALKFDGRPGSMRRAGR